MNKKISIYFFVILFLAFAPLISAYDLVDDCRAPTSSEVNSVGLSDLYYQGTTDQEADQICEALWSTSYSYGWSGCASSSSFDSYVIDEFACASGDTWYPAVCCATNSKPFEAESTPQEGSSTSRCEGTYVSACEPSGNNLCFSYNDGDEDRCESRGCTTDAPAGCEEAWACCAGDEYGQCDRDQYICVGDPTCSISECSEAGGPPQYCDATYTSCSGLSQSSCEAKTETDQDGNYVSGCKWTEASNCLASQTEEITCSGTYQATENRCTGEYWICDDALSSPTLNFLALITGQVISTDSYYSTTECDVSYGEPAPYALSCTTDMCNDNFDLSLSDADRFVLQTACNWEPTLITKQCSDLDANTCDNTAGCTKTITCTNCQDTDGGVDYFTKGTSTYGGGTLTDYCVDSNTLMEYSCDNSGATYTCPNGCFEGACVEKLPNCQPCESSTQCASGVCSSVLGPSGKRCVDSGFCPTDSDSQCQVASGGSMCAGVYIGYCNGGYWSTSPCDGTCDGTVCVLDPILTWRNSAKDQILSSKVFSFTDNVVSLVVENPTTVPTSVDVKESDSEEGALNSDETITSIVLSDDSGRAAGIWIMSEADFLLSPDDTDDVFEFYFEYEGEKSPILTVTKDPLIVQCSNGIQDGDETEIDCGGSCPDACPAPTCSDGKQNQNETDVDCGGECGCPSPTCDDKLGCIPEKATFWADEGDNVINTRITLDANNLSGNVFKMIIQNPSATPGDFELKEYDGLLINDNLGTFTGTTTGSVYEYAWTTKYANFWDAESSDSDGIYEFYFNVDGETSLQMEIEVIGTMPTCDDGVQNGAETGVNFETGEGCGGECDPCPIDPCLGNTVCTDYDAESKCLADGCSVAENSVPPLGGNEVAKCYWDESKPSPCNAQILSTDPSGKEIGGCNYIEEFNEDTCDDDGFLSYSYNATWIWAENNVYTSDKSSNADYVLGIDGKYHYDPERSSLKCQPGSRTVQCPAQIQLTFFDWRNLIAVVILIIIGYFILEYFKNKKRPKIKKELDVPKKKVVKKTTKKKTVAKKSFNKKK